jgi:O-acetyl-ADP-ribose deacetylase (regulator of RNase III)
MKVSHCSITQLNTEVVVNAANENLQAGSGVCGAIFAEAGHQQLQEACDKIGHCHTGEAVITPGFNLNARYIIHAVGPRWQDGRHGENELLYSAYYTALELAVKNNCKSIGFPLISAGIFGFPFDQAWESAIYACRDFQEENPDNDILITFAIPDDTVMEFGEVMLDTMGLLLW